MMHRLELRRNDGANGALICRSVRVSARLPINGTHVQACSTTNAVQSLFPDWICKHMGASVVEHNDVKLLWTIVARDPGPNRSVGIHPLPGRRAGKQLQKNFQILEGGNHLLDPDDRYQDVRQ